MSLAQRQKLAHEQALKKAQDDKRRDDALWSGIDSSAFARTTSWPAQPAQPAQAQRLESPACRPTSSAAQPASELASWAPDPWDFDPLSSELPSATTPSASKSSLSPAAQPKVKGNNDAFDFESFDQPFAPKIAVHVDQDDQADDILGVLAMPVSQSPKQSLSALDPRVLALSSPASPSPSPSSADSSRAPSPASGTRPAGGRSAPARARSPPPHVVGQIVEMGFSPQEARRALTQTDTGVNVEAALELLVGTNTELHQTHDGDERLARKMQAREQRSLASQSARFRDSDDGLEGKDAQQQERHRHRRHPEPRGSDARAAGRASTEGASANTEGEANTDWQQQADQFYAQASEIGTSVLNKATAFWSSAKAQAQKALEERNRAAVDRSTTPSDAGSERHRARRWGASSAAARNKEWEGKPRWMVDAALAQASEADSGTPTNRASNANGGEALDGGGFKDSDNEDGASGRPIPEPPTRTPLQPAAPTAGVAAAAAAMSSVASTLWGSKTDDPGLNTVRQHSPSRAPPSAPARPAATKAPYASPNRRGPTRSDASAPIAPKAPLKRRPIPSDASHSISSANRNKEEGNDHFRRGAYGDAEASYTRGISALESSSSSESIRLVPLLSNRANVRLKNGDASGTIADCDQLLSIILSLFGGSQRDSNGRIAIYRASQEASLPAELAEINLRETYGKALVRRAQALEASERWKLAKADWEVLLEYEKAEGSGVKTATSNMKFAREGLHRCGKMLGEKVVGPAVSSSAPARRTADNARTGAIPRSSTASGGSGEKASAAFADQQQKQAAEESAKFALKDSVDAKIDAWKRGKETNLRALLSSLDTIVWPGLGWKPIALHQVLDQAGLKKNYTKAIARLHPDKISKNATTEQKMIASAAFHALNEAWNAQQN